MRITGNLDKLPRRGNFMFAFFILKRMKIMGIGIKTTKADPFSYQTHSVIITVLSSFLIPIALSVLTKISVYASHNA